MNEVVESAAPESADAGSSVSDWRSGLSEEIRNDPSLTSIQDINGLAKSFIHGQKMIGADKVVVPKDDSTPEEWGDFYNRLGRPEKYEIAKPEIAEGLNYDAAMEERLLGIMHGAGLSQRQAQSVFNGYMEYINGLHEENVKESELSKTEWNDTLKKDFGKAFEERLDLAQRAVNEFGGDDLKAVLDETGLGNHPGVIKAFANVGQKMMEAGVDTTGRGQSFQLTPESAQQEIARLQRDPNFMNQYSNKDTDGHAAAVEKFEQLFKFAYPDENG